ncbi:MAG TPA: lysophospholipid acyltransferase family protein [Anaeromyxobacteraceae bacterium]|nr:lysophospholipid acyltransferase family protein [Anaeromyxobacteraceae bacterium]
MRTPLELSRLRWDTSVPAGERLRRTGARAAQIGLTTLATRARLAQLKGSARDGARERALVLRDVARRILTLHGLELDAEGPLPIGPALLAANHVSWLDPLVVASLVPCIPISKADVSSWPVVGSIARELGVVFVERGNPHSGVKVMQESRVALSHGVSVLNFPEGTTTRGATVLPFRKGLFGLARRAGVPVVPITLAYDPPELAFVGDDAFLPHWLSLAGARRAKVRVHLGMPLASLDYGSAEELAQATRERVKALLEEVA